MEKIIFTDPENQEDLELYLLEQTCINGTTYLLAAEEEEEDFCCIYFERSTDGKRRCHLCNGGGRCGIKCHLHKFLQRCWTM